MGIRSLPRAKGCPGTLSGPWILTLKRNSPSRIRISAFSDGRYLAVTIIGQMEYLLPNALLIPAGISRSDLRIWDLEEGKTLVSISIDDQVVDTGYFGGVDLVFSPDSKMLAVGGRKLRIYRLNDLVTRPR